MKITITARDYGQASPAIMEQLRATGHTIVDCSDRDFGSGTSEADVIQAIGDSDIVICGPEPYTAHVLENLPNLKLISRRGVGFDNMHLDTCRAKGIRVITTPGTLEGAVAEHVMAYLLYFARHIDSQNSYMHQAQWHRVMMPGLKGAKLGLVGFGGIGKEIAKRAVPFGMDVTYYCRHPKQEWEAQYGVRYEEMDTLLATCDYVSVNVPLTDSTRNLFDATAFAKMKQGSIFINIARGGVMDVHALKAALESGHLAGAAVDVFPSEPCTDSPLVGVANAVLTPHTAPYTATTFNEMNQAAAAHVLDYLAGNLKEGDFLV